MANQQIVAAPVKPAPPPVVVQPAAKVATPQVVQLVVGKPEKADEGMSGLEFTSSAISSLAWPVAAVIIAVLFRTQIAGLLNKIRKFTWGDKAVDFAEQLDKAEKTAQAIPPNPDVQPAPPVQGMPDERFEQLVALSPNAAIIETWGKVENAINDLARDYKVETAKLRTTTELVNMLKSRGLVNVQTLVIVDELRKLRNTAAHNQPTTTTDAFRFKELSDKVLAVLVNAL